MSQLIANVSSVFGLVGWPTQSAYCASKAAVKGYTESLRHELRGTNVRAVCIHPGGIDTPMTRAVMDEDGRKYVGKKVAGLKRMGEADEVAAVVAFLASDDASYCTGAEFVVDGGVTASAGF